MSDKIPEDLKQKCPLCAGVGHKEITSCAEPGTLRMGSCHACKGRGWIWALDQQEMVGRIARLEAEVERLSATVSNEDKRALLNWANENNKVDASFEEGYNAIIAARVRKGADHERDGA